MAHVLILKDLIHMWCCVFAVTSPGISMAALVSLASPSLKRRNASKLRRKPSCSNCPFSGSPQYLKVPLCVVNKVTVVYEICSKNKVNILNNNFAGYVHSVLDFLFCYVGTHIHNIC